MIIRALAVLFGLILFPAGLQLLIWPNLLASEIPPPGFYFWARMQGAFFLAYSICLLVPYSWIVSRKILLVPASALLGAGALQFLRVGIVSAVDYSHGLPWLILPIGWSFFLLSLCGPLSLWREYKNRKDSL